MFDLLRFLQKARQQNGAARGDIVGGKGHKVSHDQFVVRRPKRNL